MDRRSLRKFNHYLSSKTSPTSEPRVVLGKMGERDRNTGRYRTTLDNLGVVPTKYLGLTNSRAIGSTTEIDLQGWSDS